MSDDKKKSSSARAKKKTSRSAVWPKEIAKLQAMLVKSVLTGQPVPGSTRTVNFPDAAFLHRQPTLIINDENVSGGLSLPGLSKPARILSNQSITDEAKSYGDMTYLHFARPVVKGKTVQLTLHAKIALHDQGTAGLSTIQVTFRKVDDHWEVIGDPVYSAA